MDKASLIMELKQVKAVLFFGGNKKVRFHNQVENADKEFLKDPNNDKENNTLGSNAARVSQY